MIKRTCLLIDDSKQDDVFPTIEQEGRKYSIEIKCLQFNVGNQERRDLLTNEEIDVDKVINVFKEEFNGEKIDLIAFDWDLSGSVVNGPLLLRAFNDNNIREKIPKILYSGILKDEIQKLCENYRNTPKMPFKDIWAQINTLIQCNILTFVSRDEYEIAIVEQLRKVDDTIESGIEEILREFPDFKFQNKFVSKSFQDKTYGEILTLIEADGALRNEMTKEITQQVIAYLTGKL